MKKTIHFTGVFSIATGAMISSGIFVLPGIAFASAGPAVFISYILAGILALLGVLSIIELSTAMPKSGGDYFHINRTFGALFGTFSGLLGWIAITLKSAFAIFGITEILLANFGIPSIVSAACLCLAFFILNVIGVKEVAIFQIFMVSALLLILLAFVALGIPQVDLGNFDDMFSNGLKPIIVSAGFIFVSFGGLLKVANISEEVVNPKRNIPLGMICSIIVVTLLYGLVVFVLTGLLAPEHFTNSLTPVSDAAESIAGLPGYIAIVIASLLAFVTTANAGLLSASRYPLALSRDGLIPPIFAQLHTKNSVPIIALSLTSVIMFLSLLLPLELLVKAASTVILTSYVLTNLAVIVLRKSELATYKPTFLVPFFPWLQIANIVLFSYFIIDLGADAIEISLFFLLAGVFLYIFYGRKRSQGEFALLHLLKKLVDRRLTEGLLETELRDIVISRDEIEQDAFDKLIREAGIVDISEHWTFAKFLERVAPQLAEIADLDTTTLIDRYTRRQEEYNTAISDFLAIPHITLDGENKNFLYIVRTRDGVDFGKNTTSVKAIFFLGGTPDRRVLHLKTIASIASLVVQSGFQEEWMNTTKPSDLRHLMLMSKRKRYF